MTPRVKARLTGLAVVVAGLALAAGLALYGLSGSISFFMTPSQVLERPLPGKDIRLGGMVEKGSIAREGGTISFTVTDTTHSLRVRYTGILPDLFREGQGVVTYGAYDPQSGVFIAKQVLAKHDENYMPPELKKALAEPVPAPAR